MLAKLKYPIIGITILGSIASIIFSFLWSVTPDSFNVSDNAKSLAAGYSHKPVRGSATTGALIVSIETMLDKPGGFISNDIGVPGMWLDNIKNWEYGVLLFNRDLIKSMRDVFSRSQSQSREDSALAEAEPFINFSNNSWLLPPSESEYRKSVRFLRDYLKRLGDDDSSNAQFYSRADNLERYLVTVESRLGSLSQRLSAAVGKKRINTDLAGEAEARQSTAAPTELLIKTPWLEIDDVFYEAKGSAWALIHFLKAIEIDFAEVLEKKNARISIKQIIRELEATQSTLWSPMVMNGGGWGIFSNHSLVMANYISRANAAIMDLRSLLDNG